MAESGSIDIDLDLQFGELLKDWIDDWSDEENSEHGDWPKNANKGEDVNVSVIIM